MSHNPSCETSWAPDTFDGFRVVERERRAFAVPNFLEAIDLNDVALLQRHPAVVWAPSKEELATLIDDFDPTPFRSERIGSYDNYDLLRHDGRVYGVPQALQPLDLNLPEDREREGVVCGASVEEVRRRIEEQTTATSVEFAGWLPVFERFGNCGTHPQFAHTQSPPPGYRFVQSRPRQAEASANGSWLTRPFTALATLGRRLSAAFAPAFSILRNAVRYGPRPCRQALAAAARLFIRARQLGARPGPTLRFLHTRHFQSQVMLPTDSDLLFLTSVPYTYGQKPWVIEVEDSTSLFFPFVNNGRTSRLDVRATPCFPVVKALLESDHCRGILTHVRSTAETLPTLFQSEIIARKTTYAPLGVKLPARWQRHDHDDGPIDLLFTNSWHQNPQGFYLRGGLDVLEAYAILRERYPQVRLTIRAHIPRLGSHFGRILEDGWVRVISRFLPAEEMDELQRRSHIYLLPAARIHIVSLLQAMSYGQAVVVSDGWGIDEYVTHERNGLVVKGRGGKVSWMDYEAGVLREDYSPMFRPDPVVVEGLVEAVSRLVEERSLRRQLGRTARADVETKYNLEQWNAGLKAALDRARGQGT